MHPYRVQEEVKREFGTTIRRALDGQPGGTLYKSNILDLYGELFYSGAKVVKLQSLEELPEDQETVYLISTEFPQYPDRSWSNLLPAGLLLPQPPPLFVERSEAGTQGAAAPLI